MKALALVAAALSLALATLSTSGCTQPNTPVAPPSVVVPLAPGNTWIGLWRDYDDWDNVILTFFDTTRVIGDTVVDGERRYLLMNGGGLVNREDGLYSWWATGALTLRFKYPARVGDAVPVRPGAGHGDSIRVVSTDTIVTVPAGTFSCHHRYSSSSDRFEANEFLAVGVGFIKRVQGTNTGSALLERRRVWELTTYTLNSG